METLKAGHPGLLYRMAFINRVALFDAFIPDVVNTILANVPTILESKKMLTLKEFTEHTINGTVNELIARKESTDFGRKSLTDQANWIKTYFNLHLCSKEELRLLIEISERRNLFSHNNGVVNEIYLEKVKDSPQPLRTQLTVDFDYWYKSNKLLLDVSRSIKLPRPPNLGNALRPQENSRYKASRMVKHPDGCFTHHAFVCQWQLQVSLYLAYQLDRRPAIWASRCAPVRA